ncbi:MAG: aldehyde dehydrogenase family protein [Desulfobacteraceae bacterium]|nr:aldehyde dehydrogenase family protein [Desulfobacteraceae bacterium]
MQNLLESLGIQEINYGATTGASNGWRKTEADQIESISPIDGKPIARVIQATVHDYEAIMQQASESFEKWRMMPAPQRGQVVREMGEQLRKYKEPLGRLVTLEMGKIIAEGFGEVQEMIDMADFCVGQSRQLYGLTMSSERPEHRMYEQWHPLGQIGIITAFNFPVAVWSWNALLAAVCGNVCIWKPSSHTPLTAIAVQNIIAPVIDRYQINGVFNLVIGSSKDVGNTMVNDPRMHLISATGSTAMGRRIGPVVAERFGKSLLELGGNNAIIVSEDANIDLAVRAITFGAVGTAGQRCTSTRRIIVHRSIKQKITDTLIKAYSQIQIGDPRENRILMGPLVDENAVNTMMAAIQTAQEQGARLLYGGHRVQPISGGFYVEPTIMEAQCQYEIIKEETFAPILYILEYETIQEAIQLQNNVPQGLSSSIFTESMRNMETFLSARGSDCGIANVNIGTSGAEIGGAFGGEKETGGGREAGSDAWKIYMRRQTCTINWSKNLPLAQGITFD